MTLLATFGWAVVHSLWQCALIAGFAALAMSLLRDRYARLRYAIGCLSLAFMVVAPAGTAIAKANVLDDGTRRRVVSVVDSTIGMPTDVSWRAVVVPAAAGLWLCGLVMCFVRIGAEVRRARALRRHDLDVTTGETQVTLADLQEQMRVRGPIDVCRSTRAGVPMVLGWRRPLILLPAGSLAQLTASQLRAVLAHELAHVRRRDYVLNLFQLAADAVLFHHPAAGWLSRRVRIEREYCCDDEAAAISRDPVLYARALAAIEESRGECRLAVAAGSGTLLDRIQRIAGVPRPILTPMRAAFALAVAAVFAGILLVIVAAVPPSLPLDVKMRTRMPGPAASQHIPPPDSLPRKMSAGAPGIIPTVQK
jgi:beta-lactamase regulating signal transducer with metallopeptidase domain